MGILKKGKAHQSAKQEGGKYIYSLTDLSRITTHCDHEVKKKGLFSNKETLPFLIEKRFRPKLRDVKKLWQCHTNTSSQETA